MSLLAVVVAVVVVVAGIVLQVLSGS
jgi:hypothetical protein